LVVGELAALCIRVAARNVNFSPDCLGALEKQLNPLSECVLERFSLTAFTDQWRFRFEADELI
jgi:hypothetical protein